MFPCKYQQTMVSHGFLGGAKWMSRPSTGRSCAMACLQLPRLREALAHAQSAEQDVVADGVPRRKKHAKRKPRQSAATKTCRKTPAETRSHQESSRNQQELLRSFKLPKRQERSRNHQKTKNGRKIARSSETRLPFLTGHVGPWVARIPTL